jgi:iron complex outermembrane receptor protein
MQAIGCRRVLCAAVSSLFSISAALAQVTNEPADSNAVRLPTVVVVAQKEPATVGNVPVSVSPVTTETIEQADIQRIKQAENYSPNTFINEFTARALSNPFFRGIGGSPQNPGVTTFIDGVPQLNTFSANREFVDVDQIEFVRGPQGPLFGRNTQGGVINITSRRPVDLWTAGVQGEYGNYDYGDVRGNVSGPILTNLLDFSVAGGYSARDGYTENDFNHKDVDHREGGFGQAQLMFNPTERLEIRFIVSGEHDHDGDYALGDLGYIRAHPNHVLDDFTGGFNHRDIVSGTLLANYYGEAFDLASISGAVWWKNEGLTDLDYGVASPSNFGLFSTRDNTEEDRQFTQEFRVSSAKERPLRLSDDLDLAWQSGVFLFSQSYNQNASNFFAPPLDFESSSTAADLDDWGAGVYGQARLTAWERVDLSLGVRVDYENKHARLFNSSAAMFLLPTREVLSDDFTEASPRFGLAYHFMTNQMVYGEIVRGYRAGGFNPIFPTGHAEYETEHTWNYEIGQKSLWLDGRLETALSLFYIDYRNIQLNQPVATAPGQFYIGNAGAADSKGVEFEVKYRASGWCDLFGDVGYTDAKFLSGSSAYNPNIPPAGASQSVSGNRLPYTPTYTANLGTQLSWSPIAPVTLYARAEVTIYGDFKYDASNAEGQDTYALADFRAGMKGSHWFVEGWARNAFDSHYVPIAIPYGQLGAPSGYVGESGAPVTFGLRAGMVF